MQEHKMAQLVKVLETSQVAPPPGSVPSATLPLTFFDLPWLTLPHGRSLFFYQYPYSTSHFIQTILPNLKHSLSLTLQSFYPYAGNLIIPPRPQSPFLRYLDGQDSLTFIVAESSEDNFDHLKADYPRDTIILHPYVPKLPTTQILNDSTQEQPTMIMQVTVFPNSGLCIGNTSSHVAGDGVSFVQFMKYWMSTCMSMNGDALPDRLKSLPCHDCREAMKDPGEITAGHLERFWNRKPENNKGHDIPPPGLVRATFSMSPNHIKKLKNWVTKQSEHELPISTFIVTMAFVWSCLTKSIEDNEENGNRLLLFNVDCRNRLDYPKPIPNTYFGNCMAPGIVTVEKSELIGENGVAAASGAIVSKIRDMLTGGLLKKAPGWGRDVWQWVTSRCPIAVAGAPRLGLYDMDFGLGKPCKAEIVHIEDGGSIAFCESRDGNGGVEIGLALGKEKMEAFATVFEMDMKFYQCT